MSESSISAESECSVTSGSNSEFGECSSLEGSVSLPKRTSYTYNCSRDGNQVLVDEHDTLWCTEYAQDIITYLRRIENMRRIIMYKSPQIYHRANLVELIKRVAVAEKLGRTTVHLAVYMLDVFMDTYKIVAAKLNLVAFACLLVAAKIEERDQNIPKISTLNSYTDNEYPRTDFKTLERMILNFFKWSLLVPTSATFLECYAHQAITKDEIQQTTKLPSVQLEEEDSLLETDETSVCVSDNCSSLAFEFLELTLNERRLVHVRPSILSAACIAAARKVCEITTIWPERLQLLTKCNYDMISEYVEALICLRDFQNRKNYDEIKKTPDSGCLTDSESESQDDDDSYHCPVPIKRQRLT